MTDNQIKVLLIEDEDFDVRRVRNTINLFGDRIKISDVVSNGNDALKNIESNSGLYDIVVMDYQIAGALHGVELIKKIKAIDFSIQIIVITKLTINITDFEFANSLMEAGAFWYCTKYPGDIEEYIYQPTDFFISLLNANEKRKLEKKSEISDIKLKQNVKDLLNKKQIISVSSFMESVKSKISKLAQNDLNVLISGESGTGKELVAYNIHYESKRKLENFVPINCGSIPQDLIESELFGYEKGAFTGANKDKQGLFEIADKGTIFLDEIGELPLSSQVKLLRVIQEGEIEKIGRQKSKKVDVRLIAATNKDLEKEVEEGRFREDLFYRLNVVPIQIIPLRKRKEDIELLLKHFLELYCYDMGMKPINMTENALELLVNFEWPGNVRQLKNIVQRLIFDAENVIDEEVVNNAVNLSKKRKRIGDKVFNFENLEDIQNFKYMEQDFRKEYLTYVRERSSSDADAANKIGIAPPNFHRMCKELKLK